LIRWNIISLYFVTYLRYFRSFVWIFKYHPQWTLHKNNTRVQYFL
jgi:hypothetical protein